VKGALSEKKGENSDFKELVKEGYRPGFTRVSELDLVVSVSKKVSPTSRTIGYFWVLKLSSRFHRSTLSAFPSALFKLGTQSSSREKSSTSSFS